MCALLCLLSYVCFHMCALICVLSHVCFLLRALLCVLSYVCSNMSTLMCSHMSAPLCSHLCVILLIITTTSLVPVCPPTLFGASCRDNVSLSGKTMFIYILTAPEKVSLSGKTLPTYILTAPENVNGSFLAGVGSLTNTGRK